MSNFFVEFEICDDDRLAMLVAVFDALRVAKRTDDWRDDAYWLTFFDDEARSHFWWPTEEEKQDWARHWFSTPVELRFSDPSLQTPWDFGSMIEAFENGEYELLDIDRLSNDVGRLTFDPYAHPYGGAGCMRALIEAFGHRVTSESDV